MISNSNVAYLSTREEAAFCAALNSNKYKFLAYLMLDCGLRVSNAVELRIKDFDFHKRVIRFIPKKKRNNPKPVEIPITQRIIEIAAEYWKELKDKSKDSYMFPTVCGEDGDFLDRKQVWRYFKQKGNVNPHKLRHTCATKLIESGQPLHVVKELLCHSDSRTTELYVHASEERKLAAIRSLEKNDFFTRLKQRWFPSKAIHVLPMSYGETNYHVGREKEMQQLIDLAEKKVNILLIAPQGMGKTHLLDNFNHGKILRIDDCKGMTKTLANMIIKLCDEDKEEVARLLNINTDVITRESQKRLVQILIDITQKHEYTLIIDDVTALTPLSIKALETLRGHFHIIAAARRVEVKNASWLSNFEKVELKPLNRGEAIELIIRASEDFKESIQDFEMFKNHVFTSTNGIPQFILEMVERYRKEKFVHADSIRNIGHTAARGEISVMPFLLVLVACVVVFKFYAKEAQAEDKGAFMLFGGAAMVGLMFLRFAMPSLKRKFI